MADQAARTPPWARARSNKHDFFKDQLVLIVGGSGGIGAQIAADLMRRGARTIIVGHHASKLTQLELSLRRISDAVATYECDIGRPDAVQALSHWVLDTFGCPDVLINSAGFATYRTFEAMSTDEMEELVSVNFAGPLRCVKAFLPSMIERSSGRIANIASIAGRIVITPNGVYSASKHGLVAWSEALGYELARFNIGVHVICPGRVETGFFDHPTFRERRARFETRHTVPVEVVSRGTLAAIEAGRRMTYIPRTLGVLVWLTEVAPFLAKAASERLMLARIETIYAE